jgi:hypothetical protein
MSRFRESFQTSINFRDELLGEHWPDDYHVAELIGVPRGADAGEYVERARVEGRLLGVWSKRHCGFVYPAFQFDQRGKLRPEVAELLSILPNDDPGGWRRAFWLYSPHSLLDGLLPAESFTSEPAQVLEVARQEFASDQDAGW